MKLQLSGTRMLAALVATLFLATVGVTAIQTGGQAQILHHKHTVVTHKRNFVQRHPTLTSVAAGVATYKVLKATGKARAAHGRKLNFAQRHPMLSGVAAGAVTHHMIKKSMKHHA